jgi:hypothetical protein
MRNINNLFGKSEGKKKLLEDIFMSSLGDNIGTYMNDYRRGLDW